MLYPFNKLLIVSVYNNFTFILFYYLFYAFNKFLFSFKMNDYLIRVGSSQEFHFVSFSSSTRSASSRRILFTRNYKAIGQWT